MTKMCPVIKKPCIREECEGFCMVDDGLESRGWFKRSIIKPYVPYCSFLRKYLDIQSSEQTAMEAED